MQYMLLIYEDESVYGPNKSGPALQEIAAKHMAYVRELGAVRVAGAGLKAASLTTTVRTKGGAKTIHDGPFAETKEQLGGYYVIDVANLDTALEWAARIPAAAGSFIEVRPNLVPPGA